MFIDTQTINETKSRLIEKYGRENNARIEKGVAQCANFWQKSDGSRELFVTYCLDHFIADSAELAINFERISTALETINGHFNKMSLSLKEPLELDRGEIQAIDRLIGSADFTAHFYEDLFSQKISFWILLNFPSYPLIEKQKLSSQWDRQQWAYARLGDMIRARVPAACNQRIAQAQSEADQYIADYNIYLGNLRNSDNQSLFPADLSLISHWGLRDELKSQYQHENGLARQEMIMAVMQAIIDQTIPAQVINNPKIIWNPFICQLIDPPQPPLNKNQADQRYEILLAQFHALRELDAYYPDYPTAIERKFLMEREFTEQEVRDLFHRLLTAPQIIKIAQLIEKRLGRTLRPFDIWYNGFQPRSELNENELDQLTTQRYPDAKTLQNDLPRILKALDFDEESANCIASRIVVDPARGVGHAAGASMRSDVAHLRTRFAAQGLPYKGYNIATHEFGHNVEQTISLNMVDHYLLSGVPSNGFTEAFAFVFQNRDQVLLGLPTSMAQQTNMNALQLCWSVYEIMGVSLLDIDVWQWLYQHPHATAEELKHATLELAKKIWNQYYAPVFNSQDQTILAIYSHMIAYPLYLADYPLGHLIQFQIESYLEGRSVGKEMTRMCKNGRILPQLWLKQATGRELSADPLLQAVDKALQTIAE